MWCAVLCVVLDVLHNNVPYHVFFFYSTIMSICISHDAVCSTIMSICCVLYHHVDVLCMDMSLDVVCSTMMLCAVHLS